ncbi:MAG: hypothetical protein M0T71_12995 [Actinomycetota bacterium]|nr:hypothetical protein [Actinomycetota bacterium]
MGIREALTSSDPGSLSSALRRRRYARFLATFPGLGEMRVLDLGGRPGTWLGRDVVPAAVVCVNLEAHEAPPGPVVAVQGDACDAEAIGRLGRFDLVYSNSAIEHVGGHANRRRFADSVEVAADRFWIQTPNRYFPIEPHAVWPGFQFLPFGARRFVAARWPLSPLGTGGDLDDEILAIDLLSASELRHYFPQATIWRERVAGLTKSLVALRA